MNVSRELIERAEGSLGFDPQAKRKALVERAPAIEASPSAVQRRLAQALGEGPGGGASELAIDRILYGGDQLNVSFLERGMIAADAVARLEVFDDQSALVGSATGFMVSPRLLLTNHHVLPTMESAARSWADFRHEYDALGRTVEARAFALDPATFFFTDPALDVSVVAVVPETPDGREQLVTFGWLSISASPDTVLPGEALSVVHHPRGRPKQVAIRSNLLLGADALRLWYVTETATASSGAPVFNDAWQVVAVHCLGVPARDRGGEILTLDGAPWSDETDESDIVWRVSLGTPAAMVVHRLAATCGGHPLVRQLLAETDADAADAIVVPLGSGHERAKAMALSPRADGNGVGERQAMPGSGASPLGGNGNRAAAHDASEIDAGESITITVPLRITVHPNESGGRAPVLGVDLS